MAKGVGLPRSAQKPHGGFLASMGEMRSDGDGRRYWPPRPAQKSRGDFFVAGKMPGDVASQRYGPSLYRKVWAAVPRTEVVWELLGRQLGAEQQRTSR